MYNCRYGSKNIQTITLVSIMKSVLDSVKLCNVEKHTGFNQNYIYGGGLYNCSNLCTCVQCPLFRGVQRLVLPRNNKNGTESGAHNANVSTIKGCLQGGLLLYIHVWRNTLSIKSNSIFHSTSK